MTVRFCYLPRDHTAAAINHYAGDWCNLCGCVVLNKVGSDEYTAEERGWRHVQHPLGGRARRLYTTAAEGYVRRAPALTDLRAALLAALPASHAAAVRDGFAYATTGCLKGVRAGFMPLFLDPVLFLGTGVPSPVALLVT